MLLYGHRGWWRLPRMEVYNTVEETCIHPVDRSGFPLQKHFFKLDIKASSLKFPDGAGDVRTYRVACAA